MKIFLFLTTLFSLPAIASAQQDTVFIKQSIDWTADTLQYETDTILFESGMVRHILAGTTILPSTHNQMNAWGYGLFLQDVTKSDCQSHGEEVYWNKDKINFVDITDSTLKVDITVYDNCCYDFLCDAAVDSSGVLNLIYHGYGGNCACDCCFGLIYHFERSTYPDNQPITSVQIQGDLETRKKFD